MITFSHDELAKFAAWLEQEAQQLDVIAKQSSTMDGLELLVRRYRSEAAACMIVAQKIRNTELQVI